MDSGVFYDDGLENPLDPKQAKADRRQSKECQIVLFAARENSSPHSHLSGSRWPPLKRVRRIHVFRLPTNAGQPLQNTQTKKDAVEETKESRTAFLAPLGANRASPIPLVCSSRPW